MVDIEDIEIGRYEFYVTGRREPRIIKAGAKVTYLPSGVNTMCAKHATKEANIRDCLYYLSKMIDESIDIDGVVDKFFLTAEKNC